MKIIITLSNTNSPRNALTVLFTSLQLVSSFESHTLADETAFRKLEVNTKSAFDSEFQL